MIRAWIALQRPFWRTPALHTCGLCRCKCRSADGALQSLLNVAPAFGGMGEDTWSWALCDAPTLLYAMLALGLGQEAGVQAASAHLVGLYDEVGWRCRCGPELGRFRGSGRKADPCPIANVYALKSLSLVPELLDSPAARWGVEMLLGHWERRTEVKYYLFGVGSDFRKLKYPFVWYDILRVVTGDLSTDSSTGVG